MAKVISISDENYEALDGQKTHYRESFNDVVTKLLGKSVTPKQRKKAIRKKN